MPHYFSEDNNTIKSNPKKIAFRVHNEDYVCMTDHGVFAKDGLDRGTSVLLKYLHIEPSVTSALDLGCGYGTIGLVLAKEFKLNVDMVDVNKRALELSETNLTLNHVDANVYYSNGFEQIDKSYDIIVSNPPIRIGKTALYSLLEQAKNHLNDEGYFTFVINKKHGAESALTFVRSVYNSVEIIGKDKGFYIITCKK